MAVAVDPGSGCGTDFGSTACLLICWLTGQGALGTSDAEIPGWQSVDTKNKKVKAVVKKQPVTQKHNEPVIKKPAPINNPIPAKTSN